MLDFSMGELLLIGGAAYVFLGPREVSSATYIIGKLLGRAVGFMSRGKNLVAELAKKKEIQRMYSSELSQGLRQFADIQRELHGVNLNPIDTVRRAVTAQATNLERDQKTNTPEPKPTIEKQVFGDQQFSSAFDSTTAHRNSIPVASTGESVASTGSDVFMQIIRERNLLIELEKQQVLSTKSDSFSESENKQKNVETAKAKP